MKKTELIYNGKLSGRNDSQQTLKMFDLKALQKLVSLVFIALMLCSTFAGVISAEDVSEDISGNTILNETKRYDDSDTSNTSDNHSLTSEIDAFLDANKPIFVFFYAEWCHFCKEQKLIIDDLEKEYSGKIAFSRVDAEENLQAIDEFGVTGFPAMFLIVDRNEFGWIYQGFSGFTEKEVLKYSLDYVVENGSLPEDIESSSSLFQFKQTDLDNFSIVSQGNSSKLCVAGKISDPRLTVCYSNVAEAVSHVPSYITPRDCFVWVDGWPPGYPWTVIPGTGCAHWVAHELGIKRAPGCFLGYSIRVSDVISKRKNCSIFCCEVGDIWTTEDEGHCGIVVHFEGEFPFVKDCSERYPGVGGTYRTKGYCWKVRKTDREFRKICRGDTVVTQRYDICEEWVDKNEIKCPQGYKCVERQ